MHTDRQSLASRLRLRDITQPITKSVRGHFVHGSNLPEHTVPVQSGRYFERHLRDSHSINSPNDEPLPAHSGMAIHTARIPSMADVGLRHSLSPHEVQQRLPTCQMPWDCTIGSESHTSCPNLQPQDDGWQAQQTSRHYINLELDSPPPFPPSYSSSSTTPSVLHHLAPIRTHQYHSSLSSFVNPPTSSAVPPISESFQSPSHPRYRPHHQFAPDTPPLPPVPFHSPESPLFPPDCFVAPPEQLHSNFHEQIAHFQTHQCHAPCHFHCSSASVPRSLLAAQQQPVNFDIQPPSVYNLNSIKRPLHISSNSSSGNSHRTVFAVSSSKHQKPINTIPLQGLFDHLQPYLYSSDPFNLENSPELYHPHALVFPTAQQELDPDFRRFPKGLQASDTHREKMVNNKNDKTSTAPNHNLVGHRIDAGRLEFMSVLGLGAYGVVYLAKDLQSPDMAHPRLYAVKALNKVGLDARQKSFQRREISLHSLASPHTSIVTLHAVIESPSCIFVILDYCPDGDLFGMITEKQKYLSNTELIKKVFIQIIEAVQFCHRLGISHRDLKPENILCKKNGHEVVLADFGLATSERTSSDFGCGSTFYMSPECQGGLFQRLGSYSTLHNDVWSLGVILVNLTCGRNPWKQACPSDETFRAYLANPDFLRSILPVSDSCNKILKRIFALNPLSRISLTDLKIEIARVDNFNMTSEELSKSTRATREAARAWRSDVPPSPKLPPPPISWKNTLAKKTKKAQRNEAYAQRHPSPPEGASVWDQPVRYEESSSSSSATFYDNGSSDTSLWNYPNPRPHPRPKNLQNQLRSPIKGIRETARDSDDTTPRIRFVSPPPTPRTPDRAHAPNAISGRVPTGPLVSAFTSASISSDASSSSEEWNRKPRGFASRFGVRKHVNFVNTENSGSPSTRKKLLMKPISFNRPNAPSPLVIKPATPDSSASSSSSRSRGLITPTAKNCKQAGLTFLPSTPPSSASPNSTTFGFARKQTKFFPQEMPLTPSTPSHPGHEDDDRHFTGLPPRRRVTKPVAPKKKFDQNKFSLFSSSDEEGSEIGGTIDADFDPEEEDDDDDDDDDDEDRNEGIKSTYLAYAEWANTQESAPATVKAQS